MNLEKIKNILSELSHRDEKIPQLLDSFNLLDEELDLNTNNDELIGNIEIIEEIILCLMKKVTNKNELEEHYITWVTESFEVGKRKLKNLAQNKAVNEEVKGKSFRILLKMLPLYNGLFNSKPKFPTKEYSELIEMIILTAENHFCFLNILKEYMIYTDMRFNFWIALDFAVNKLNLEANHVQNILDLIETTITKTEKFNLDEIGPVQYYCGVKIGVLKSKEVGTHVQNIWYQLSAVDVPAITRQHLLHILLERMIFRMDKPIFLTDYFMSSLQYEGPVSILALQGIFTLIQKHNINYPNIYGKLYNMLNPNIFGMHYKTRLFFLMDVFLSSLSLSESLVAGFAKRLARLSLIAPPSDILVLMALITNLIIRHSGLKKLITNMELHHFENDPYISRETDPAASMALESSLWEIKILQNHVLPNVSAAAMFIENPLPSVECDLSDLLENDSNQIFSNDIKKKLKEPPISFEHPSMSCIFWINMKKDKNAYEGILIKAYYQNLGQI